MPNTEELLEEYAELVKRQQGEIISLQQKIEDLNETIQELQFEMSCKMNKEYDV